MGDTPDFTDATVFTSDPIVFQIIGLGNAIAPGASVSVSVAQYASLIVVAHSAGLMAIQLDFHQSLTVNGANDTTPYSEFLTCADITQTPTWVVPVTAGSLLITNLGTSPLEIIVRGSNRTVTQSRMLGGTLQTRSLSYNGPVTSGTVVVCTAIDGGPDSTGLNDFIVVRAASASIPGLFGFQYVTRLAVTRNVYLGAIAAGGNTFAQISQPLGIVKWLILPSGGTGTSSTFTLDLTPV